MLHDGAKNQGHWPLNKKVPNISQGSAVTRFMCGGIFNNDFIRNLLLSLTEGSVKIGQRNTLMLQLAFYSSN